MASPAENAEIARWILDAWSCDPHVYMAAREKLAEAGIPLPPNPHLVTQAPASPAENEKVVREALSMWLRGEPPQTAFGMGHAEVALALAALRAQAEAGERAREALRRTAEHAETEAIRAWWRWARVVTGKGKV